MEHLDKLADLKAEKGKLGYSSKEVLAIKDQNKSLKVEILDKNIDINNLRTTISNLEKQLKTTLGVLNNTNIPRDQLKDLESENRALVDCLKQNSTVKQTIAPYEKNIQWAHNLGNDMVSYKKQYHDLKQDMKKSIESTYHSQRKADHCDSDISDLKTKQTEINKQWEKYESLQKESDSLISLFKGKRKKELQVEMSMAQSKMDKQFQKLKEDYSIEPTSVTQKINFLESEKAELLMDCKPKKSRPKFTNRQ